MIRNVLKIIEDDVLTVYPAVTFGFGASELAQSGVVGPRVIWVPSSVSFKDAVVSSNNPRSLITVSEHLEAHCFESTFKLTELLRNKVIGAIYRVTHSSFDVQGGRWLDPGVGAGDWEFVLLFTVDAPVTDEVVQSVTVTSVVVPDVEIVTGPGWIQFGGN